MDAGTLYEIIGVLKMKSLTSLKTLTSAVALLSVAGSAQALTPWADGTSNVLQVYVSGGAAQDLAFGKTVEKVLAQPGTLTVFQDNASNFAGYYFTPKASLGLTATKVYLEKRSRGAAGYGVVPLGANGGLGINIDHLDLAKIAGTSQVGDWNFAAATANAPETYTIKTALSTANANTFLVSRKSDGGFLGVDYKALLKSGTDNYPNQAVTELTTGTIADVANTYWDFVTNDDIANNYSVIPTGGLVYGVGVTLDLYKVLQKAQGKTVGVYDEANLPSLSRDFLASLLAGKVSDWTRVYVNGLPLTSYAAAAGVTVPAGTVGDSRVALGRRNKGAAIGAVAYAKILNYPYADNAFAPAADATGKPFVKSPAGAAATGNFLNDLQNGANVSGLNPSSKKYWGLAVNSADRNANTSQAWRYIKIDGAAPTLANVAAGSYPVWAEGQVLVKNGLNADATNLLTEFGKNLGSVATALEVNPTVVQPWGATGIFATTQTDNTAVVRIPFDTTNPVVGLTTVKGGESSIGSAPIAFSNGNKPEVWNGSSYVPVATSGVSIELK